MKKLVGATTLALELAERYSPVRMKKALLYAGTVPAVALWLAFLARTVARGRASAVEELREPKVFAAYAASGIMYMIGCERLAHTLPYVGRALACVGFAAQPVITLGFLGVAVRARAPIEPYFTPAFVNSFVVSAVGSAVLDVTRSHLPPCNFVVTASFGVALVLLVAVVPPQIYRVLVARAESTHTTTVAAMMTSCSVCSLATGLLIERRFFDDAGVGGCVPNTVASHRDTVYGFAQALSVAVTWLTAYALLQRRAVLRTFGTHYVALLPPTCAAATAALVFADVAKGRRLLPTPALVALDAYATVLATATLTLTLVVAGRVAVRASRFVKDTWQGDADVEAPGSPPPKRRVTSTTVFSEEIDDDVVVPAPPWEKEADDDDDDDDDTRRESKVYPLDNVVPDVAEDDDDDDKRRESKVYPLDNVVPDVAEEEAGDTVEVPRAPEPPKETPTKGDHARALLALFDGDKATTPPKATLCDDDDDTPIAASTTTTTTTTPS
eukprot:CAMPEP_0198648616 /NCGR_PEP_ID=MMETSP1467-20131203/3625_1 /TAXON_ID=1462469 /ORGANISM="unid. sp., Strain CCMP2135" /LENGTH=498 /DNA_ID=CAMNT_0044384349 /DNA_START=80 /DNA_END=1576 /DNA_ORIENTATION=-